MVLAILTKYSQEIV